MALIDIIEVSGETFAFDIPNDAEATIPFLAYTTSVVNAIDIKRHPDLPKPYSPHRSENLFVRNIEVDQRPKNPFIWDILANYTSKIEEEEEDEDPLARPAKISFRFEKIRVITMFDADGHPLLNTAGDLLEGIERDETRLIITVKKNVARVPRWIDEYNDAVSSDAVKFRGKTFPKGTLKFEGLDLPADEPQDNGIPYIPLTYELHHRPEGWRELFVNRGFNQLRREVVLDDDGEIAAEHRELVRILIEGELPAEPQLLDEQGRYLRLPDRVAPRIIDGGPGVIAETTLEEADPPPPKPVILIRNKLYRELPFRVLPRK